MKRSEINTLLRAGERCFLAHGWTLPPAPLWDVTDFGLGNWRKCGLVAINLANEPEYCEKLMFARRNQATPCHTHARKKEDIICRAGSLTLQLWPARPTPGAALPTAMAVRIDGEPAEVATGCAFTLAAGSRITLFPGVWHTFWPASAECIIGEVSTANDDVGDNFFLDPGVGRVPLIEEDEPAAVRLIGD